MSDHHSQSSGSPMGEAKIQKRKELSQQIWEEPESRMRMKR